MDLLDAKVIPTPLELKAHLVILLRALVEIVRPVKSQMLRKRIQLFCRPYIVIVDDRFLITILLQPRILAVIAEALLQLVVVLPLLW